MVENSALTLIPNSRMASFLFDRKSSHGSEDVIEDWEVVQELELYPKRFSTEDGSVKYGGVRVTSILELDASKTWVLVGRADEDHVLAWSPCDGERAMIAEDHLSYGVTGLLLAQGSSHFGCLTVDDDAQALYVVEEDKVYSSLTDSWQPLPTEEDPKVRIPELGKTCIKLEHYCPRLNVRRTIPTPAAVEMLVCFHWYKGSLYAMGGNYEENVFKLFTWDDDDDRGWQEVDSHPMYCHGVERPGGDRFFISGGARYFCTTQVHEKVDMAGRFLVVYDLEERKWYYHTIRQDGYYGFPNALVCNRGRCNNVLDRVFTAVWTGDIDLLQLPPHT